MARQKENNTSLQLTVIMIGLNFAKIASYSDKGIYSKRKSLLQITKILSFMLNLQN